MAAKNGLARESNLSIELIIRERKSTISDTHPVLLIMDFQHGIVERITAARLLRAAGADSLVLAGISTSGVVLPTLREAADLDYRMTVLSDACADPDPEVHRVLLEKVFPRQALVTTTEEWIESF